MIIFIVLNQHDHHQVQEGTHHYKFLVDGHWCTEESEPTVANDLGNLWNVVQVENVSILEKVTSSVPNSIVYHVVIFFLTKFRSFKGYLIQLSLSASKSKYISASSYPASYQIAIGRCASQTLKCLKPSPVTASPSRTRSRRGRRGGSSQMLGHRCCQCHSQIPRPTPRLGVPVQCH